MIRINIGVVTLCTRFVPNRRTQAAAAAAGEHHGVQRIVLNEATLNPEL